MQQCMELTSTNRSRAYPTDFEYGAQAKIHKSHRKHSGFDPIFCLIYLWRFTTFISSFEGASLKRLIFKRTSEASTMFGDDGEREPRVPISNTTVKPFSADGTWTAGSWESRTLPSTMEATAIAQ